MLNMYGTIKRWYLIDITEHQIIIDKQHLIVIDTRYWYYNDTSNPDEEQLIQSNHI